MTHVPPEAWFFRRGPQLVRLVREYGSNTSFRLFVYGPGTEVAAHDFSDVAAGMKRQAEIEHQLLGAGYHLVRLASDGRDEYGV